MAQAPRIKLKNLFKKVSTTQKEVSKELNAACDEQLKKIQHTFLPVKSVNSLNVVHVGIKCLAVQAKLTALGEQVKTTYTDVFSKILHIDKLPKDIYAQIHLKDADKMITTRSYSTPCKYKEVWATCIQQHLDAGRIQLSNSQHASPAFLVPKSDNLELPCWVNDYRMLNTNTILDAHPIPHIDDILADCGKGRIWSKLDMTNSFFQTLVHPDDIHKTTVTTPFGLYEWVTMPMGLKNSPLIHQRCMTAPL